MSFRFSKVLLAALCILTACSMAIADSSITPYANLVFESAGVSIGKTIDADFDASMHRNCTSIYISSCTLEKKNSNGTWSFAKTLTPPSDKATNTSDFGAYKVYSSSCTSGNTYRIKATFAAVYEGKTYTVSRTSNSVAY